jgi:thioester reductase-like protein
VNDSAASDRPSDGVSVVTGFPGFIGRRLVRRLLDQDGGGRIVALVEERAAEAARAAAGELDGQRLEVLGGDITDRRLGLAEADYERVRAGATSLFHLAAVYDLAVPADVAQRVNVEGTGNVLGLCSSCERLERLIYVSTAYVSGLRTGTVYEHELAMGQGFKNHYESTKFQAEVWVRSQMDRVPTAILRPAIVVGDSATGETQKFDGPYYLLRTISRARRARLPIMRFGAADAPFNVVPVDYVVAAIAAAAAEPAALGETLHLVDPEPLTTRELVELLAREYADRSARPGSPRGSPSSHCGSRRCAARSAAFPPSRCATSTIPCTTTPAVPSRCSGRTDCARPASPTMSARWSNSSERTRTTSSTPPRAVGSTCSAASPRAPGPALVRRAPATAAKPQRHPGEVCRLEDQRHDPRLLPVGLAEAR